MAFKNPICVALDTPEADRARVLLRTLKPHIGFAKIGLEFFYAHGPRGYEAIAREGVPIFLDLKLHDIPNTVAAGLKSLLALEPPPVILNVHAAGGLDMLKAAAQAVEGRAKLVAVTILTSLTDQDLWKAGFDHTRSARTHARMLAKLADAAGLDGVVCSPHEVETIKHATRKEFLAVVPGIRPDASGTQDQKRVATPQAARDAGADILVIGRPITGAPDPAQAAQNILASLHAG
jgi:orotidine-5'-phosphate decarboxylase